jgi:hypothetical protein
MSSEEENWRTARVLITEEDGAKTLALVQRTGGYGATDPPSGTQVQYACSGKYDDEQGVPNYFDCFEGSPGDRKWHHWNEPNWRTNSLDTLSPW